MARKQVSTESTAAAPARVTKKAAAPVNAPATKTTTTRRKSTEAKAAPAKTRTRTVRHAKAVEVVEPVAVAEVAAPVAEIAPVNANEEIARIAYGYWVARGYTAGDPVQDWLRAEAEYAVRVAIAK